MGDTTSTAVARVQGAVAAQRPQGAERNTGHAPVNDDPKKWSPVRKWAILLVVTAGGFVASTAGCIYLPSIAQVTQDLHATSNQISLSVAIYALVSAFAPIFWSSVSELWGRRVVFLIAPLIGLVGSVVAAEARNINVLIGMRAVQSLGMSCLMTVGAATLADIYESRERGSKLSVFYSALPLGGSLGPLLGGILAEYLTWRSVFWFLSIGAGVIMIGFVWPFKDSWRKERSKTYQAALRKRMDRLDEKRDLDEQLQHMRPQLLDANPFPAMWDILKVWQNWAVLIPCALIFGFSFSVQYTATLTLETRYGLDALDDGLILLVYGVGAVMGSLVGGNISDRALSRAQRRLPEDAAPAPEQRLKASLMSLSVFPALVMAYGWTAQASNSLPSVAAVLFLCGFGNLFAYSTLAAYLLDANAEAASIVAAAVNLSRNLVAFAASELAVPVRDAIGEGGLYTMWGCVLYLASVSVLVTLLWGEKSRQKQRADATQS